MLTVTKRELVNRIAEKVNCKNVVARDVVQAFLDEVVNELARGNRLEFREFGVFEPKFRAARMAQNPKTLQRVEVAPTHVVKFKVGRILKERLKDIKTDKA